MPIVASGQMTITDLNDAKQLIMYVGASQSRTVIFNGVSTYAPLYSTTNQVLTPQLFIAGLNTDVAQSVVDTKWYAQTNGAGTPVLIVSDANNVLTTIGANGLKSLTLKSNVVASVNSMTYICELTYPDTSTGFNVISKSEIEIVKVTNGTNGLDGAKAISAILSNDSDVIPTDSAGANGNFTGASTTMTIYEGATDVSATWTVVASTPVGLTGTLVGKTYTVTAMSTDTAYIDLVASKTGFSSITRRFALSKSKTGVAGTTPTLYRLIPSANAIARSITGVYNPTTLTLTAKSQTGTGVYGDYSGRYQIWESVDGTNWGTVKYASTANEVSKVWTPTAGIKAIKTQLFLAGGVVTMLDEQIIPVVFDGATGANSVYAYVWTPDGNAIKNSVGTVTATVDVYSGSTSVVATAFKWYAQDPTATVASGGDADGGAGWRLLNSTYNAGTTNYTTKTLTIPSSAVAGSESFKCVATYSGVKYTGVTTVVDLSDPILVRLDGIETFKNGTGTTTIKAVMLQAGAEIDVAGTLYTYSWSIYDSNNVKTAFTATGKSIVVNATAISGRGNLVCDVSN